MLGEGDTYIFWVFCQVLHSNRGNRGYKELHNDRLVVNMDEEGGG